MLLEDKAKILIDTAGSLSSIMQRFSHTYDINFLKVKEDEAIKMFSNFVYTRIPKKFSRHRILQTDLVADLEKERERELSSFEGPITINFKEYLFTVWIGIGTIEIYANVRFWIRKI